MTSDDLPPIKDETVFRKQLHRLLLQAYAGGISVEGGWACMNSAGTPSWDVEIFRVNRDGRNELADVDDEL
jgi:hypothetical protein